MSEGRGGDDGKIKDDDREKRDQSNSALVEKLLSGLDERIARLDRQLDEEGERLEQCGEPNPLSIAGVPNLTDLGNGERMCDQWGDRLHYSTTSHGWYIWDKRLWNPDAEAMLNKWAAKTVKGIYTEASRVQEKGDKERVARHAIRSESKQRIAAMIELLRYQEDIPIDEAVFDTDPWLVNFLNGTVDLKTGELKEHRREDLITKICPVEYDENARSEVWESFLDSVTDGDKELKLFLQRAAGYSLCGDYSDEVLFFVYGPAATGKTTFKDAIKAMMGSYAATADIATFLKYKGSPNRPRNDLARLARTRMVITDEVDEGSKLATGLVKLYTGGDTMTARFLFKEHFEFKSRGKLWIVANFPPKVSAEDGAIWRRILRVPFLREIPTEKQDQDLKRILCDPKVSGPAIAAWAVEGCLMWQSDGLAVPEVVKQSTEEYRTEMNPIHGFIEERCTIDLYDPEISETSSDLWDGYQSWAEENGIRWPVKRIEFGKHLKTYGLESKRQGHDRTRAWCGIKVDT